MKYNQTAKTMWFKRKKYGWGWTPNNAQGSLSILIYTGLVSLYPILTEKENFSVLIFSLITIPLTIALVALCYLKGEKPKWSWGADEKL